MGDDKEGLRTGEAHHPVFDLRLYRVDDTEDWPEEIAKKAGSIFSVCVFDANHTVEVAAFTPAYHMVMAGPTWTTNEASMFDRIPGQWDYTDLYVHARDVNLDDCERVTIPQPLLEGLTRTFGDDIAAIREAAIERVVEELSGNGYLY